MNVASADQRIDVRLMWLWRHGIAQKHHGINLSDGQARADLQVTAHRTAQHAFDFKSDFGVKPSTGRAGRYQVTAGKELGELLGQRNHVVFLVVVRDQGDVHTGMVGRRRYGQVSIRKLEPA